MISFRYEPDSVAFVDAAVAGFAEARNIEAITRIQQYQVQLEESCLLEARRLLSTAEPYSWYLPFYGPDFLMEMLDIRYEEIRQPVPLNSLAVIGVLFDLTISPQRNFRSAQKIFSEILRQDIELRDERERPLFNSDIATVATSEESGFFSLFNLFIQEHPSLLDESAQRRWRSRLPTSMKQLIVDIFNFAAHEAARSLVKRIQGEADGRSK